MDTALVWFSLFLDGSYYPSNAPAQHKREIDVAWDSMIALADD